MVDSGSNPAIAAYLAECDRALQHQADKLDRLDARLAVPMPQNTAEWEALNSWLAELRCETRKSIPIEFYTPDP